MKILYLISVSFGIAIISKKAGFKSKNIWHVTQSQEKINSSSLVFIGGKRISAISDLKHISMFTNNIRKQPKCSNIAFEL